MAEDYSLWVSEWRINVKNYVFRVVGGWKWKFCGASAWENRSGQQTINFMCLCVVFAFVKCRVEFISIYLLSPTTRIHDHVWQMFEQLCRISCTRRFQRKMGLMVTSPPPTAQLILIKPYLIMRANKTSTKNAEHSPFSTRNWEKSFHRTSKLL
jgi:hypothetical protein